MVDCGGGMDAGAPRAVDPDRRLAGPDSEHDDAEEITEIVPAAIVGNGVDRDVRHEERKQPRDREDEAVPEAEPEARRLRLDGRGALPRRAAGEEEGAE